MSTIEMICVERWHPFAILAYKWEMWYIIGYDFSSIVNISDFLLLPIAAVTLNYSSMLVNIFETDRSFCGERSKQTDLIGLQKEW